MNYITNTNHATSYTNGSLCQDYVRNHVGFVNVYSPAAYVLLTKRDKAVFFYDQIGTIHIALKRAKSWNLKISN